MNGLTGAGSGPDICPLRTCWNGAGQGLEPRFRAEQRLRCHFGFLPFSRQGAPGIRHRFVLRLLMNLRLRYGIGCAP